MGPIIMEKYLYVNNEFMPTSLKEAYTNAGMWDEEKGVFVSEEVFQEFPREKDGKVRVTGKDGMPAWADLPEPTHEELVKQAEVKRQYLLSGASFVTSDWRTNLALGIIDDEEKEKLTEWMKYIRAVKAVDVSTAPDIQWPEEPAK